jgi:uncharacterized protein (TIGR02145 family)
VLTDYLGGKEAAGGKLKATTLWEPPNTGARNSSGFTAFPGGWRNCRTEVIERKGLYGHFWSATETESISAHTIYSAWSNDLFYKTYDTLPHRLNKDHGLSVRCIKD